MGSIYPRSPIGGTPKFGQLSTFPVGSVFRPIFRHFWGDSGCGMVCKGHESPRERERERRERVKECMFRNSKKGSQEKIGKQAQQTRCENQQQNQRTILEPWPPNMQFTGWTLRLGLPSPRPQSQPGGAPPKPGHGDPGIGEACLASCPSENPRCTVNARDQTGTYNSGEHHPASGKEE